MKTRSKTAGNDEESVQHFYLDGKNKQMAYVSNDLGTKAQTEAKVIESKPQKLKKIKISDDTNIDTLIESLVMEPKQSLFKITFQKSSMSVQQRAEQYWSVLLAVSYCNSEDKAIKIEHNNQHNEMAPNWNFTKKSKYKRYQKVKNSGRTKLIFGKSSFGGFGMFQTTPDWNKLSTKFERVTTRLTLAFDVDYISNTVTECVRLKVDWGLMESAFKWSMKWRPISGEWAQFSNCDRLELFIEDPNDDELQDLHINLIEVIEHPNLHVIMDKPIQVRDGYPKRLIDNPKASMSIHEDFWFKRDVESFAKRVALSSVKTLRYSLPKEKETVTFNCDNNFPYKFMEFLNTQPIYRGNRWESFMTLELAKKSFGNKSYNH